MSKPAITSMNLVQRIAILEDGSTVPITNLIDSTGEDTEEPSETHSFVCGPMPDGTWVAEWVENFDRSPTQ